MNRSSTILSHREIINRYPGVVIMFRSGDTYEVRGSLAKKAARILSLRTHRDCAEDVVTLPATSIDAATTSLVAAGHRVGVCEFAVECPHCVFPNGQHVRICPLFPETA